MTTKNILLTTTIGLIAILSITILSNFEAFAEEEKTGYSMAENVRSVMTFTFRDGVEVHEFPVYSMTTDFVSNRGTTFKVEGIVGDAPLLHQAQDESYKYRVMLSKTNNSFEFNFRYFDVSVDFFRDDTLINSKKYQNCQIDDYATKTLNAGDYESYMSSKSGFAVIDEIEFTCGGFVSTKTPNIAQYQNTFTDYATVPLDHKFAEDVRTIATFDFDTGSERIEFHGFELDTGYAETSSAGPSFTVERTLDYFPLLEQEINNSRNISALHTSYNSDFNVDVEFVNSEKTLRNLEYTNCHVTSMNIVTQSDKEEGFTGKSGFALVQQTGFTCAGMTSYNPVYDERNDSSRRPMMYSVTPIHSYNVGTGAHAQATFTYLDGSEIIDFPIFIQSKVLGKSSPTFTLQGIVGDFPMLYERVDENLNIQKVSGSSYVEKFDVDVELLYGEKSVRGFNYSDCRVVDYDVGSAMNKEENYLKGQFALENTFQFECRGYTPNNPAYDAMFKTTSYGTTLNTKDLKPTDSWGPNFKKVE